MKGFLQYAAVLLILGLGVFFALEQGRALAPRSAEMSASSVTVTNPSHQNSTPSSPAADRLLNPLGQLLVQLVVILAATRMSGKVFTQLGQPAVVGEMLAGILLGPSLLGWIAPGTFTFLFPSASLDTLKQLSQIGVCLFMFVVGLELDLTLLRGRAQAAVAVSHSSILFPFFLGVILSLALFPTLAGPGISFVSFALFMGVSMSITAFPVLARILQERRMEKTPLGTTALTCAAVDDVTAWSLLALVVAIVGSDGISSTVLRAGLVLAYVGVMLLGVRPLLSRYLGSTQASDERRSMALALILLFASALTTEMIGIHALFGSFLAGVVMPQRPGFRDRLKVRLESVGSILLLPLFFAVTGLRTQIGVLNEAAHWRVAFLILLVASVGKIVGTLVPARFTGMSWRDSFSLGALMNTRGLMELVAINVGYDLGILSPPIFAMLVLMAMTTTLMTGPLLGLAERWGGKSALPTSTPAVCS